MNYTIACSCLAGWFVGGFFTMGAIFAMGEKSDETYGDSYSGDDTLDFLIVFFWMIFWPCWIAYHLGGWLFRRTAKREDTP